MHVMILTLACNGGLGGDDSGAATIPVGILVQPEQIVVPTGTGARLTATGLYDDRTSADITHLVDWSSANNGVAKVSNDLDQEGLVSGVAVGDTVVTASLGGVDSVPVNVVVTDAELVGLTVEPKELDLAVGDEVHLQAIAAYSDGNRADSSSQVRWITDDGGVAQIASGGVLTAAGAGSTTIHADWDGTVSPDVTVTVVQNAAVDLKIREVEAQSGSSEVVLTVVIENTGSKGSSDFFVDAWLDPSGTPEVGDYGDDYALVEYVGAGSTTQLSFSFEAGSGHHTVAVVVDSEDSVEESNEGNNVFEGSIDVSGSGGGPNLEITYFDWVSDETQIYYVVDVTNSGGEDVGSFYVDLYLDQSWEPELFSDGDQYIEASNGLGAGETGYADFLFDVDDCWYCTSWVLIDSYDQVEETDEDDNVGGPVYAYNE
jgi:hypothetical protein